MRSLIGLMLLCGLVMTQIPAVAQETEKTLLWRISGNGVQRPSYLFGTLHLKAKKLFNFPDSLYTAIGNTDVFALEINPDSMSNMLSEYVTRLFNKPDDEGKKKREKRLREILTSAELKTLRENLPPGSNINPDELTLKQAYLMKDKLTKLRPRKDDLPTFMDAYLYMIAKDKGRMIGGVEHMEDQIGLLENVDMDQVDPQKMVKYFNSGESVQDKMIELYIARDIEGLQRISELLPEKQEDLMLTVRNKNMARAMDSIMHGHSLFCAVGALHLPGKNGLIKLLRDRGYTVEPVVCSTYTNGADYEFKTEGENWVDITSGKDGYSIKMPGQPNDVNAANGTVVMKMYYDLATSRCYVTNHINRADTSASSTVEVMDGIADKIISDARNVEVKPVSNGTLNGKEYFFTGASNIRYHMQIIGNTSDLYLLSVYSQSADVRNVDSFFKTFKLVPKTGSARIKKEFDDILLTVSMPDYKPSRSVTYSEDSSEKQTLYTIIDPAMGVYYFIVCNEVGVGYNFNNDTIFLHNVKENLEKQELTAEIENARLFGYNAYKIESSVFSGMKIKSRLLCAGNRQYHIMAQYPVSDKGLAEADSFLQGFQITPTFPSAVSEQVAPGGGFSSYVPVPFYEDTSGRGDIDTTMPVNYVYKSFDKSTLITYDVQVKKLSPFYWRGEDSLMLKAWLDLDILKTDSTATYTYYRTNGMLCGEAIAYKSHSDKIHRIKVIGDGSTRYTLDCTYPASMKNNKRIDSFYSAFRVLRKDTVQLQQSSAKLFADLHSADSATREKALSSMSEVFFSKRDVPVLLKELTSTFADDADSIKYHPIANQVMSTLKLYEEDMSMAHLEELYHDPMIARRVQQSDVLQMMAAQKDSVAAYKKLKQLLLTEPPIDGSPYMLSHAFKKHPLMAKTLYPELLTQCADSTIGFLVCSVASSLLDSSHLSKKDIESSMPMMLDKSRQRRAQKGSASYDVSLLYLFSRIGTKEAWDEIAQYQYVPKSYLRYNAVDLLSDSARRPDPVAIDSIAADKNYRLTVYNMLDQKMLLELFPTRYMKQEYFAESYLSEMDEDGMYGSDYKFIGTKTVQYKGKKQKFYLYKVEAYDDSTKQYLGVAGPFSTDSKKYTISYEDNACGFGEAAPDMANLENQLKVYLIQKKIDDSRQESYGE